MAHSEELPPDIRAGIARQLGSELGKLGLAAPGAYGGPSHDEMYASYPLYTFDAHTQGSSIRDIAAHTGRWHHQLRRITAPGGAPATSHVTGFATSRVNGPQPTDWEVVSIFGSTPASETGPDVDIASEINGAAEWIDSNVSGDPMVRLLILPSFLLYAFWLFFPDRDEVIIIDMPQALSQAGGGPFQYQVAMDAKSFLQGLRSAKQSRGVQ